MNIRPVKDLIDNKTNQPIFVKSHAKATFMTDGKNVEDVIYELKKEGLYSLDIIALGESLGGFKENEEDAITAAYGTLSEDMYNTIIDALEKNKLIFNCDDYQGTVNVQYEEGGNITLGSHIVLPGTGCLFVDLIIVIYKNTLECNLSIIGNQKIAQLDEKQDVLVSGKNIKTINGESILGSGNITINSYISTTYDELKELRVNNQLKPGTWYRITDYVTTTTQEDTQSANHPFDVLVLATSENTLSEEARAIQHDEDTYFAESDLNAWEIKYTLDNDTNRFTWADSANGKGVIYRMIDEHGNNCPYDFKNIQFKRKLTDGVLDTENGVDTWCYTFNAYCTDDANIYDASVIARKEEIDDDTNRCYGNIIKEWYDTNTRNNGSKLNDIVFLSNYDIKNKKYFGCYSNTFGNNCYENTFGSGCYNNSFGNNCQSNSFGNNCWDNSLLDGCSDNSFGDNCYSNSFGNGCWDNTFGTDSYSNSFGNNCSVNCFIDNCWDNSFENECCYNSFGENCYSNSFGNSCSHNSFGENCYSNSFGNSCSHNSFRNSASETDALKDHCVYNHFDDGCSYNVIWNSDTTSSSVLLKNINVNRGVYGTDSSYNYINVESLNSEKEINVNNYNGHIYIDYGDIFNVTYTELVELRDNAQLIPGRQYRIIDYVTSTTQKGTQSANHPFDVIVTALDDCTLSEEAQAIQHDGDEYFSTSNLNAWKIWYCLDNDANRFGWIGNALPVNNPTLKGINPECFIFVDGNGNEMQSYENVINDQDNNIFCWHDYTNDNEGNNTLVLYKTNINGIQQDSDYLNADSSNVFFYQGTEEYDGVIYDKWRKIEPETYTWDNEEKIFVLTKQIVENNSIKEEYLYNAESIDGTGVIYRMIDEYGNDCPYDFKNIQFVNNIVYDSRNCSINASLVDGNLFNEPFTPVAYMFIDTVGKNFENYEGFEGKLMVDLFYEYGYETTPDGLENQLCLFKSDVDVYEDERTDYSDKFFYWGTYDYDGETYDMWKKAEMGRGVEWFENKDDLGNIFILTNRMVEGEVIVSGGADMYTFTWVDENNESYDASILGNDGTLKDDDDEIAGVYNNIIGKYIVNGVNKLPKNVFVNTYAYSDGIFYGCYNNTLGNNCYNNTLGNVCTNNTFGDKCSNNTFGDECSNNTFGNECIINTLGVNCQNNTFGSYCGEEGRNNLGNDCQNNTFGNYCDGNTLGESCYNNTFGIDCDNNSFGENCYSNTFGNSCDSNTFGKHCENNTFGNDCDGNTFGDTCNNNIFSNDCESNTFGNDCGGNTFGNNCYNNTFGDECSINTFGYYCYNNTFGDTCSINTFILSCHSNTFGDTCSYNTFGNDCYNNIFSNDCESNTFGNNCDENTFGNECGGNTFGNYCSNNTFDIDCGVNTFGDGCYKNTFGDTCYSNTFGNNCWTNTFGYSCGDNTFGDACSNNTFGNVCEYNTFGNRCNRNTFVDGRGYTRSFCSNNVFENDCSYNKIITPTEGSETAVLQNLYIHSGFSGGNITDSKETVINKLNSLIEIDIYQDENGNTCINQINCGTF